MAFLKTEYFPDIELTDPNNEQIIEELIQFLQQRIQTKAFLAGDLHQKQNNLRNILVELKRENVFFKEENLSLRAYNDEQDKMISSLQSRICKLENHIDNLLRRLNNTNDVMKIMQQELKSKDKQLKQLLLDKQKIIQKYSNRIQTETNRIICEFEAKLHEQRGQLEEYIKKKDDKLKLMKQILISDSENTLNNIVQKTTDSCEKIGVVKELIPTISKRKSSFIDSQDSSTSATNVVVSPKTMSDAEVTKNVDNPKNINDSSRIESSGSKKRDKIPVVNPKYRLQSLSKWIDHRPTGMVPVGTILQPQAFRKRSVTKLTDPKPFVNKPTGYCLFAQEQDTDGELETKLYKADVLPTSGGGAQVVFNDIECLKQVSPTKVKQRSRQLSSENSLVHS